MLSGTWWQTSALAGTMMYLQPTSKNHLFGGFVEKHTCSQCESHSSPLQDIVLLGDFNAGCSYVSGSDWQQIRIFTDETFHWLITDAADTTVTQTVCPYDR